MGGLCSRSSTVNDAPGGGFPLVNGQLHHHTSGLIYQSRDLKPTITVAPSFGRECAEDKQSEESLSCSEGSVISHGPNMNEVYDGIPRLSRGLSSRFRSMNSKQAAIAKVTEVSSLLGRAGTAGIGKAVEVLDTLGSSMTSLNMSSGFSSGVAAKGSKISILAFEVANTIVKAASLMQSLSKENIMHLIEAVLPSQGVQNLISRDVNELLSIAAADKREELEVFSREVVRFGNRCKDPQWHSLDRYFEKLDSEPIPEKHLKEGAEQVMQELMALVTFTAELYHEMHALDRFEQDYRRKLQEEDKLNLGQRGDSLALLKAELKSQKKHVKSLKRKSLWSKILEEVIEKLVDIVHFLHMEIQQAFPGAVGKEPLKCSTSDHKKLGFAGLALHYANIITQIDSLVSRSSSIPPNTRDALYQGLPPSVKSSFRCKLHSYDIKEELTVLQIKAEMEKTLHWFVPVAINTTKAHHGFGWVGEWANTGKAMGTTDLLRIETLYHADKEKTEACIVELLVWLHHLVIQARSDNCGFRSPIKSPIRSPNQRTLVLSIQKANNMSPATLTVEDHEMLRDVSNRKKPPGISKSQELDTEKMRLSKYHRLSKSSSHSPTNDSRRDVFPVARPSSFPFVGFDIDRIKALNVIDRVDTMRGV